VKKALDVGMDIICAQVSPYSEVTCITLTDSNAGWRGWRSYRPNSNFYPDSRLC
jgi:hypothetical protein